MSVFRVLSAVLGQLVTAPLTSLFRSVPIRKTEETQPRQRR
jgi:hypothetical protein